MRALRKLLEAGHSLIVIEHNLDVIRASDWLIDLGPEGGYAGGLIVAEGTPEDVRQHATSHTGLALREYAESMGEVLGVQEGVPVLSFLRTRESMDPRVKPEDDKKKKPIQNNNIQIVNAKEHNLKNLSVDIPRGKFNVVTGVSGSGKSTLAFDILFNEGQRRYLESLNAYARAIVQPAGRPEVDAVYGIPPTVAIEQRCRAAAANPPWAPPPRSGISCACCTSSWAFSIACTTTPPCSRKRPTASSRS
jgi:excinuclease ABC subunit A